MTAQLPGSIGNAVPDDAGGIMRRIQQLEKDLRQMKAANLGNSLQINPNTGDLTFSSRGALKVEDASSDVLQAVIGNLPAAFNRADGSAQPGTAFYRPDGSIVVLIGDRNATVAPYSAAFQVIDRVGGRVVISDDTNSGHGLGTPHITSGTLQNTNTATWPATTNATWTDIADSYVEIQNPKLQFSFTLQADPSTTGQFRLMANGVQMGTTQTVAGGTSGAFATWQPAALALPAGINVGDVVLIELDAQRTTGTGTVRAICRYLTGMQS